MNFLELKIKDKTFKLCDDWNSVSYGQFIDVLSIQNDKGYDELEKGVRIIGALSDNMDECTKYLFNELSVEDLGELSTTIKWINEDFTKEAKKIEPKKYFNIDGKRYVIKSNFNKITLGEQVCMEHHLKNKNLHPQEIALGILLRPVDENGKEEKFDTEFVEFVISELKNKINLIEVYNYISFFLLGGKKSSKKDTKGFSIRKMK